MAQIGGMSGGVRRVVSSSYLCKQKTAEEI